MQVLILSTHSRNGILGFKNLGIIFSQFSPMNLYTRNFFRRISKHLKYNMNVSTNEINTVSEIFL